MAQERWRHDHICHSTVRFTGSSDGWWWINVVFEDCGELDALIHLLEDLRDNPHLQRGHVHLQDSRLCDEHPAPEEAGDAEIVFHAPGVRLSETDLELMDDGARWMQEVLAVRCQRGTDSS